MKNVVALVAIAVLASMPIGGASLGATPPPSGGTISIEPVAVDGAYDSAINAAMPTFVDAVGRALTARGFTVFNDSGHAASVVELLLSRSDVGTGFDHVPGQKAASVAGTGIGVPFGTGASEMVHLQRTRFEMRIHKRGDAAIVWDGVAVTVREAGMRKGTDAAVAADLIAALLQAYPEQPKSVVGVP